MPQQTVLIQGRKTDGTISAIKTDNGGSLDVFLQDQTTPLHTFYIKKLLNLVTLANTVVVNSRTVNLIAGHNCTNGDYLSIIQNGVPYQGKILNVATNTLTMDTPFCCPFTAGATAARTSIAMNIDGSGTTVTFNINPIQTAVWDIVGITFLIEDEVTMDTAKFGGITALTNGIVVRKKLETGYYRNIFNIKTNGEFEINSGMVDYQAKAPAGVYGFLSKHHFSGQNNFGVVIRLDGTKNEELQILIQDNLTALSKFNATVQLHELLN